MRVAGVPLTSIITPDVGRIGVIKSPSEAPNGEWGTGGARLLLTDGGVLVLLLDQARRRGVARVFGVPLDKTGLVTVVALGSLAQALHDRAAQLLAGPALPSLSSVVFVGTGVKDVAHLIAGEWSRETPLFGPLVGVVVLGTLFRPVLRVSFHDVKASAHRARIMFNHRYGHLGRRNRRDPPLPR